MRKSDIYQLGDYALLVTQLPADVAFNLFNRLTSVLGPALAAGLPTKGFGTPAMLEADVDMGKAAQLLFARATPKELEEIRKELFACVTLQNKPLTPELFNLIFAGRVLDIYKVMFLALEVNFADFSEGLRGLGGRFFKRVSPSVESNTFGIPGPSGGA